MTDYRFGDIAHPSGGYRFGNVAHESISTREVIVAVSPYYPGDAATVNLSGIWDAADKTATLNGVALPVTGQTATTLTFTVPTPYADSSTHYLSNLGQPYDLVVSDSGAAVAPVSFTITPPTAPTFWYRPSITGGPSWDQSSVLYQSTGVSNGDSFILEVTAGGPMSSVETDGSWVANNSIRFRVKAYNADGWQEAWANFAIGDLDAPLLVSAVIGAAGNTLVATFDEAVQVGSGTPEFTVTASAGSTTATYASGSPAESLTFNVARVIGTGETASISYTQPGNGLESLLGDDVESFTNYPVTNGTEVEVATFIGAIPNFSFLKDVSASVNLSQYFLGIKETSGYTLETGTLPTGLSLIANTGIISGTPSVEETQAGISITGTDANDGTDTSNTFSIAVVVDDAKPGRGRRK
jgi:hypothetical protein